jgi:hypothetical protein
VAGERYQLLLQAGLGHGQPGLARFSSTALKRGFPGLNFVRFAPVASPHAAGATGASMHPAVATGTVALRPQDVAPIHCPIRVNNGRRLTV